jgi:hypothetical protein
MVDVVRTVYVALDEGGVTGLAVYLLSPAHLDAAGDDLARAAAARGEELFAGVGSIQYTIGVLTELGGSGARDVAALDGVCVALEGQRRALRAVAAWALMIADGPALGRVVAAVREADRKL